MYVAGSNLFGQWFSKNPILSVFEPIINLKYLDLNKTELMVINWSYNIYKSNGKFYVSGFCYMNENELTEVIFPKECENISENIADYIVVGNDYNLLLINKINNFFWILDLENKHVIKKIKFNVEMPVCIEQKPTRKNYNSNIIKVVLKNENIIWLNSEGMVYTGKLPSYVDIHCCVGNVIDVQCGYEHYILLTDAGRVYTWGNGRRLQLGHGDLSSLDSPIEIEALAGIKIVKVAAGGWHSLALSEFGDLYVWGWNDTGQLGIKEKVDKNDTNASLQSYGTPTLIDLFNEQGNEVHANIKDIACGTRHSAIILVDGSVWTTGCNKYGQLGFSETLYPKLDYFKKSFHCSYQSVIMCGLWSTVIINDR